MHKNNFSWRGISVFKRLTDLKIIPYITLLLCVYCVYAASIAFGFTSFDDTALIAQKYEYLKDPYNFIDIFFKSVFDNPEDIFYRPALNASFMIDTIAAGGAVWFYRLSNIVYHFIAIAVLFNLLQNLGIKRLKAFIFCAFFAVCPAFSQAVSWIPGRNDIILSIFIFGAFLFLIKYNRGGKISFALASALLFFAALLTKENAAGFFIAAPLYLY
jgi:hypothetical protein